jgi:hypothetical protein
MTMLERLKPQAAIACRAAQKTGNRFSDHPFSLQRRVWPAQVLQRVGVGQAIRMPIAE